MTKKYILEKRECLCGCGNVFWCLPTSMARYASIRHDPDCRMAWDVLGLHFERLLSKIDTVDIKKEALDLLR